MPNSRRPWRRGSTFAPPPVRRLSAPALRDWCGFIHAVRRKRLISPGRLDVAKQLLQFVGWRGRGQVSLAELASAAEVSHDTVGRALDDLEQLGLVRRHHQLTRDRDGRVVQAASFFELKPPPESDTQIAGERIPYGLSLTFLAWKRSLGGLDVLVRKAGKVLRKDHATPIGGDDEWGRQNRDRMLAVLLGDGRKTS
jgi:DNA-binding transcriptional ArsR family regulator